MTGVLSPAAPRGPLPDSGRSAAAPPQSGGAPAVHHSHNPVTCILAAELCCLEGLRQTLPRAGTTRVGPPPDSGRFRGRPTAKRRGPSSSPLTQPGHAHPGGGAWVTVLFGGFGANPPPAEYDSAWPSTRLRPLRGRPTAKRRGPVSPPSGNQVTCPVAGELG